MAGFEGPNRPAWCSSKGRHLVAACPPTIETLQVPANAAWCAPPLPLCCRRHASSCRRSRHLPQTCPLMCCVKSCKTRRSPCLQGRRVCGQWHPKFAT